MTEVRIVLVAFSKEDRVLLLEECSDLLKRIELIGKHKEIVSDVVSALEHGDEVVVLKYPARMLKSVAFMFGEELRTWENRKECNSTRLYQAMKVIYQELMRGVANSKKKG